MKKTFLVGRSRLFELGLFFLLANGLCLAALAQSYQGAPTLLQQVSARVAKPEDKTPVDAQTKLRNELKAFSETATNLSPADAAQHWLMLVDRAIKLQQQSAQNFNQSVIPVTSDDLLGALPPPADWSALAKAIAARPPVKNDGVIGEIGLRLLATTLVNDNDGRMQAITNLQAKAQNAGGQSVYAYRNFLQEISRTMLEASDDPNVILESLEYQLQSAASSHNEQALSVPNLVPQVGAAKAEAFLRKALVTPNVLLQFGNQNETSRLAQKLALELMPQLKLPQWGLVNSLDAVELYEALDQRFSTPTNNAAAPATSGLAGFFSGLSSISAGSIDMSDGMGGRQKQSAQIYYMLGLISHDRPKEAITIAKKLNGKNGEYYFEEAFQLMEHSGYTAELDNFFYELLSQNPALPFWDQYVELAANAGTTDRMLVLIRNTIANSDLSDIKKSALHQILFKALLAADNADEAVAEIRRIATTGAPASDSYNNGQLGALLARLGVLLQKPEWADEGIGIAKKWLATADGQNFSNGDGLNVLDTIVQILFELKRGPEAETLLASALGNATLAAAAQSSDESWGGGNQPPRMILAELASLYHQAGRQLDILDLLSQSPSWGTGDLSDLFDCSPWGNNVSVMWLHTGLSPLPVPYLAADALLATGQKELAGKVNDALLNHYPGLDRGYELLLALAGTNAISRLDELYARDQFEERPLIWKAHLLREQGQLETAEKIIRQAIAIDPSDGEEGRGDRMRAYSELAEILDARGNKKDADFYREVVKAIRLSETADQFYAAGLLKRAVTMYEQGLEHFSDAYCIQSRLAIQLAALGRTAEAEEHYRRAYELMPDSFGRVESHCFGCEKAFDGDHAQSIAEKVFTQLVAERPNKPQVHYLLGYLRLEQENYNAALTNFLDATKLDSDYLNAWVKAQEAANQTLVSSKERDEITFNILRLDPLHRHTSPNFNRVNDLAGLWNAVAIADNHQPAAITTLYPLTASKAVQDNKLKNPANRFMAAQMLQQQSQWGNQATTPAGAVAQTPFVQLAGQMMLGNSGMTDD